MIRLDRLFVNALTGQKERWLGKERLRFLRYRRLFKRKLGLEIGGPSAVFRRREFLPVYARASRIDGVDFATSTLWEHDISEAAGYRYADGRVGRQFVCEASNLKRIADGAYDFVLSSHSLEHSANPLKCMAEWTRVLRPGGAVLLVLPDSRSTFDHRRPITSFEHLLDDYRHDRGEDDLTHLEEIFALHDLSRDPEARTAEEFRARSRRNLDNRALHHHIFNAALLRQVFNYFGIRSLYADMAPPFHLIALGVLAKSESRSTSAAVLTARQPQGR
jgi:SAM-dependent methyltransferase